jgi:hypothetical protein
MNRSPFAVVKEEVKDVLLVRVNHAAAHDG